MANDPKNFRIPKEFTLFGHRYTVIIEDDLFKREECYGEADEDAKTIRIQKIGTVFRMDEYEGKDGENKINPVSVVITSEVLLETFYHELCHIIFDALGEYELSMNEKLVNMMGKSFLEVYLSSNYEEEKTK